MILCSPTEPATYRGAFNAKISPIVEEHGVDFFWWSKGKRCGVQRKQFPDDFLASLHDDRLGKEVQQMQKLDMRFLVLEGYGVWTSDGELLHEKRRFQLGALSSLITSMNLEHGIVTYRVQDAQQFVHTVKALKRWTEKDHHLSLSRRSGPRKSMWGTRDSAAWAVHLLQSMEGVGPTLARNIYEEYGLPVRWDLDGPEDLERVKGIGKAKAAKIWDALAVDGGGSGDGGSGG